MAYCPKQIDDERQYMSPVQISRNLCEQFSVSRFALPQNEHVPHRDLHHLWLSLPGWWLSGDILHDMDVAPFGRGKSLKESIPESRNRRNV